MKIAAVPHLIKFIAEVAPEPLDGYKSTNIVETMALIAILRKQTQNVETLMRAMFFLKLIHQPNIKANRLLAMFMGIPVSSLVVMISNFFEDDMVPSFWPCLKVSILLL
ncbi:hypothetical protein WICPIJ_008524 [Wickerhamomyces pijperi]|uniref:Uncharacterized protein n=1 Tax=Wickerhamomyces pijperi TaxID=599730 RepID=A0A9P8TIE8_WICPI|nr:hypothetical protein WICPIJ_008524 [Wickerhamomyces pijperi]